MAEKYYYFVTGLPDLLLDEGKPAISCIDFAEEASMSLDRDDFELFNLLRFHFDNTNLVNMIEKKEGLFDRRGSIDETTLAAELKAPTELPDYMQRFLETHREGHPPHPGLSVADHLAWYFYEAMTDHENSFVREWYKFDLHLRNVLAGLAGRKNLPHLDTLGSNRESSTTVLLVGRDDVAESILRSNAPDFGLAGRLPWIERVLNLSRAKPLDFEKGIDVLRWDVVGDLTISAYFQVENVFAFYIRLTLVERWRALDPKIGRERIDKLLAGLGASYAVPATF